MKTNRWKLNAHEFLIFFLICSCKRGLQAAGREPGTCDNKITTVEKKMRGHFYILNRKSEIGNPEIRKSEINSRCRIRPEIRSQCDEIAYRLMKRKLAYLEKLNAQLL